MLKRRQLRAAGWPLLSVPYWEWNAFGKGNAAAKRAYLEQGLGEVLSTTSATTAATATKHQAEPATPATRITALEEENKMLRDTLGMLEKQQGNVAGMLAKRKEIIKTFRAQLEGLDGAHGGEGECRGGR